MKHRFSARLLGAAALIGAISSQAAEIALSGFGTLGYAISDQPWKYQRVIDHNGTLARDTLFGVQLDATFSPYWSATLQLRAAPADDHDNAWSVMPTWAFLSWRPTNDTLLRLGKLRIPLLLHSENHDVGGTFDFLRLPVEVYSLTPTQDFTGAAFSRSWLTWGRELTLDGYAGKAHTNWRIYFRDPGLVGNTPGAMYDPLTLRAAGLILTLYDKRDTWRVGAHRTLVQRDNGTGVATFPWVSLPYPPGAGYYQITANLPGPGLSPVETIGGNTYTAGADIRLPHDFRVSAEYMRRNLDGIASGVDAWGAYLSIRKTIGKWTPYLYHAQMKSNEAALSLYQRLDANQLPASVPGAMRLTATQRAGADTRLPYDQSSWAVGFSYALADNARIKAEWLQTRVGIASSLVDAPPGESSGGRRVNVYSLSYGFDF